jgi:hypothetical protein
MDDFIPISIKSADGSEIYVEFPNEEISVNLELTQVGPRLFRIGSVPLLIEVASFGDVIEADSCSDGGLRFVRIAERGGWRTYDFWLSTKMIESEHIASILNRVLSLGGHWEHVFDGVLFLCLPPTTNYDPTMGIQFGLWSWLFGKWALILKGLLLNCRERACALRSPKL